MVESVDILSTQVASAEAALFVIFAAGVTAMTAVAFVLWVVWMAVKGVLMMVLKLGVWPSGKRRQFREPSRHACPDPVCRAVNPSHAGYCRHCGRMLRRTMRQGGAAGA